MSAADQGVVTDAAAVDWWVPCQDATNRQRVLAVRRTFAGAVALIAPPGEAAILDLIALRALSVGLEQELTSLNAVRA